MNTIELNKKLTPKLALLSEKHLNLIYQLIDQFSLSQDILIEQEKHKQLILKWQNLLNNDYKLDEFNSLSNEEI